ALATTDGPAGDGGLGDPTTTASSAWNRRSPRHGRRPEAVSSAGRSQRPARIRRVLAAGRAGRQGKQPQRRRRLHYRGTERTVHPSHWQARPIATKSGRRFEEGAGEDTFAAKRPFG